MKRIPAPLIRLCRHIRQCGGRGWLVGGAVRDMYLPQAATLVDFDLEVFGLPFTPLLQALQTIGPCSVVGKHFGVIKLRLEQYTVDIALPRREHKQGDGHRGFEIASDPHLDTYTASLRRDFTMNAMMLDVLDGTLLDMHGGQRDLEQHILRHVSEAFAEDPLRPLRAMQFAARFDLQLHPTTARLCRRMLPEAGTLPEARIWHEWRKWSLADHPSRGLQCLLDSGWLTCFPMLEAMPSCPQEAHWHPEGNVWQHTLLVSDQMARIARERRLPPDERSLLLFAALLHDVAKPATTFRDEQGCIRSPGHAEAAEPLITDFAQRIGMPRVIRKPLQHLVREHLVHLHGQPGPRAVRRLSHRLAPATLQQWEMLVEADASGRTPHPPCRPAHAWLKQAEALALNHQRPQPLVNGRMLMALGLDAGVRMGEIIRQAYEAQLDGVFDSEETARSWCRQQLEKKICS